MYYTIYKIVNLINGKIYIGSHKTKNLNDSYMGSGKYLKYAQEKYGIENFTKEILFVFDTPDEMYQKESELVNLDFLSTENTYNLKVGGFGGFDYINENENLRVEKNKKARNNADKSIKLKYGVDNPSQIKHVREKLSSIMTERRKRGFNVMPPSFAGKKHSLETKLKIKESNQGKQVGNLNSQYGTMWITNGIHNMKIKNDCVIPDGWKKGRKQKRV
jgi:group I intron endonuclease